MNYVELVALDVVTGAVLYVVFVGWYRYLTRLAARHDVDERRRIAQSWYVLLGPGALVLIMGSWLGGIMLIHPRPGPLVLLPALGTIAAVLPGLVAYLRKWKHLAKLGYGRR